jgi:SpoVK/Ycf46/Vps4 family AAA+-type ATPase
MPPELVRKGRFDDIFFVDLPSERERSEILEIHLRRRNRDPARFGAVSLARLAANFSGAELEQAVISGLYDAFAEGVELEQRHLVRAIEETYPLATTMGEEIGRLREWARTRTRPASAPEAELATQVG